MRLDELEFGPGGYADVGGTVDRGERVRIRVWRPSKDTYKISHWVGIWYGENGTEVWDDLDPFTAQAVLFDLCSRSDP